MPRTSPSLARKVSAKRKKSRASGRAKKARRLGRGVGSDPPASPSPASARSRMKGVARSGRSDRIATVRSAAVQPMRSNRTSENMPPITTPSATEAA